MAMTAAVKDELARLTVTKPCCRKAEMASLLRFAGALHLNGGHLVVEAEVDAGATARRLRKDLAEVYGHGSEMAVVSGAGIRKGSRYLVRVAKDGDSLARQTGLVDGRGRPVGGLPPQVVAAGGLAVQCPHASLETLRAPADPPPTKDAIAGRIRRLLAMADKRAEDLGIPNTEANLTPDMLADVQ